MALNFEIINPSNKFIEFDELYKLYNKIIKYDFNSSILINNLYYMNDSNLKYLVHYYTFHGSSYFNDYLRRNDRIRDEFLEKLIYKFWKGILNAPIIKKPKIVYRFLSDDYFLKNLEINDIYMDQGFLSTTRNQFYDIDSNKFGYIMLKINIPENSKGCLCVETLSLFPEEEEIILPPFSKLKLINKNSDVKFFHIKDNNEEKIIKRYEFDYLGSSFKNLIYENKKIDETPEFDFFKFKIKVKTLTNKISYFYEYLSKFNIHNKFNLKLKNKTILFYCDFYDSTDIYSKFFNLNNPRGFYFYSLDDKGQYQYFIELSNILNVNYFFRYSDNISINIDELIEIVSSIGCLIKINTAKLRNIYDSSKKFINNTIKKAEQEKNLKLNSAYNSNYNYDLYSYLKYKTKIFNNKYLVENFNYFYLDILEELEIDKILNKNDNDKLYFIFKNIYKNDNNIKDFFIYIIENYWYLINVLINKIEKLFFDINVNFEFTYYLNIDSYLFENKIIRYKSKYKRQPKLIDTDNFIDLFKNNYKKKSKDIST